jgi:peptidoglycan hydrolase CwlO-like protein
MNKITTIFIVLLFLLLPVRIFAQQTCQQDDPCIGKSGQDQVDCYQNVSEACKNQSNTLSSQISYMNSQIQLTTLRIEGTKTKITTLSNEIGQLETEVIRLEDVLTKRLELLTKRIPETYKRASTSQFGLIFFSANFSDFINRVKYLSKVQAEDASLIFQVKATQNNYNERKATREDKKDQLQQIKNELERQNVQLAQQKLAKNALLSQTQGQESLYQQLLAQAKAQLAGFASFADSQGATVLSGQTSCDGWGCYYNQRDSQWATALINGQGSGCNGPCTVMRVGCLLTSIAMVASHMGHRDILPSDMAFSSPSNFSVGTALLMRGTIYVKGVTISRTTLSGSLYPDAVKDGPVVVGVRHGTFGTHFIVIKSYTNGNYIMNDPYEAGGHDISFTDRYSLGSVFEVDRVSM